MGIRLKRVFAWFLDWLISWMPTMFLASFASNQSANATHTASVRMTIAVLTCLFGFASFTFFILRDIIFGGRSLGKRIFRFCVVDKNTLQTPPAKKRILRALFLIIYPVDGAFLLITGRSIGDRATGTIALPQSTWETFQNGAVTAEEATVLPLVSRKPKTVLIISLILAGSIFLGTTLGITLYAIGLEKQSASYDLAYAYVIQSEQFQRTGYDPNHVWMQSSSSYPEYTDDHVFTGRTAEYTFRVWFQAYQVICHTTDDSCTDWYVCKECTDLK